MKFSNILRVIIPVSLVFSSFSFVFAQPNDNRASKYWVFFTDKDEVIFNPWEYFDAKAIERRINNGLPLNDYTDLPVKENYIAQVKNLVDSITKSTRWFNALACYATETQLEQVKRLPFVSFVEPMLVESSLAAAAETNFDTELTAPDKELLRKQTESMGAKHFSENGWDGKGIRIAIFDAGFPAVDVNPAFEHIRKENRIIKTYDFVKNKEHVYGYNAHGTMVMSCIAGMINGTKIGLATGAEFLLARTERAKLEPFSEEENWLAAVEWADKNGAQIINSSLGYTYHRYFSSEMDGKTSLVSRAANMAASKGILVVNAAGNEGAGRWKHLGTPADADSVLSVGGIDPKSDLHTSFSSYGPTADKRLKPNVSAFGHVIASGEEKLTQTQGTSFSSPLVAGFVACAWQSNKSLKNMELFKEIERSGNLYPYFDYGHGYGIPQADYFTDKAKEEVASTFDLVLDKGSVKVVIKDEYFYEKNLASMDTINVDIRDFKRDYLYYHIENNSGYLDKYYVIDAREKNVLELFKDDYLKGQTLRIHYRNYTETYKFN